MSTKYSVILPVCHGGAFLRTALSTLSKVAIPAGGAEFLVVGEGWERVPPDASEDAAGRFRFLRHAGKNRSSALNAACKQANGDVWVFADDDCAFPQDWLLRIDRAIGEHPEAAVIGGRDELPPHAGLFDLALDHALNSFAGTGGIRTNSARRAGRYHPKLWNMTIRADAARRVTHGEAVFDPGLAVHEDVELIDRIAKGGGTIVHAPEIVVGHYRDTTFGSFFLRNLRMARVCRERGIHRPAHAALISFFASLLGTGLSAAAFPALWAVHGLLVGAYGSLLGAAGISGAWKARRPILALAVPALIVGLHVSRALGFALPKNRGAANQ
jgi:hypothetical protein